jgi:hypothetical protein
MSHNYFANHQRNSIYWNNQYIPLQKKRAQDLANKILTGPRKKTTLWRSSEISNLPLSGTPNFSKKN